MKRYVFFYISIAQNFQPTQMCVVGLRSLRDGCLLAKYLETVRFFFCVYLSLFFVEDLVSAMKKKLEKELMKQEIDE